MPKGGFIGASMAASVMSKGRGKDVLYGDTFDTLARQIAAARVGYDVTIDIGGLGAVQWGIENEFGAIMDYSELKMCQVESPGWVSHKTVDYVGCTPDGVVGLGGMIEVKCPMSKNHLDNILCQSQLKDYNPQMQHSMWVLDRDWCDWVSYDPRAPEGLQMYILRVERDDQFIQQYSERVAELLFRVERYRAFLSEIIERNNLTIS